MQEVFIYENLETGKIVTLPCPNLRLLPEGYWKFNRKEYKEDVEEKRKN